MQIELKKWEIAGLIIFVAAALILRVLEEIGAVELPVKWVVIVLMIFAAVLLLWRSVCFLIKFLVIKSNGESAEAVVLRYETNVVKGKSQTAEIIGFKDKYGKKQNRALRIYMTKKIGRKYTVYYDPKKENNFYVLPPSLISVGIDLIFALIIEGVFMAFLFINSKQQ